MEFHWEDGFTIRVRVEGDQSVVLSANRAGLLSLARHLAALAAEPEGGHFHLDEYNSLEPGSRALVVEKMPEEDAL